MPAIKLNSTLVTEYQDLFDTCNIKPDKAALVEQTITKLITNKQRYETAVSGSAIPWFFVAVIHNMEASINFTRHLHNGDPLSKKTINVPAGRPQIGNPPFTWEASTTDALMYKKLNLWNDWSLPNVLFKLEEYNGWGYRLKHPHILSPYLWSFSNHYTSGKYIADGTWSETASSAQCGAAVLLRRMAEKNIITFKGEPVIPADKEISKPLLRFSNKEIAHAADLQKFLNKFPGIYLKEDGKPGKNTSDAFKKLTGYYLKGDERA
jgi:lysozyme family protein